MREKLNLAEAGFLSKVTELFICLEILLFFFLNLSVSLGWEDPLEEGMATHFSIPAWRIPMGKRSLAGYSQWGCKELDRTEQLSTNIEQNIYDFDGIRVLCFKEL